MSDHRIADYLEEHLADSLSVLGVLDSLCEREFSLELHRFFVRLQVEMAGDPAALKQLLLGLDEEGEARRIRGRGPGEAERLGFAWPGMKGESTELFSALERLALGIQGKALLWRTLASVSSTVPAWRGIDFVILEKRARNQRDRVESVRMEVASAVLRGG